MEEVAQLRRLVEDILIRLEVRSMQLRELYFPEKYCISLQYTLLIY